VQLTDAPATVLAAAGLEALRLGNPAARALPLLAALAGEQRPGVVLDYLQDTQLQVDITLSKRSGEGMP
jgi:hypothetical protein